MASEKIILDHKKKKHDEEENKKKKKEDYDNREEIQFKNKQIIWKYTFSREKLMLALGVLTYNPNYSEY